jgi:hypothetical protein
MENLRERTKREIDTAKKFAIQVRNGPLTDLRLQHQGSYADCCARVQVLCGSKLT